MPKIKNDPATHLKRADLTSRARLKATPGMPERPAMKYERDFMTAPIDEAFYIDFNPSSRLGPDHRNRKR